MTVWEFAWFTNKENWSKMSGVSSQLYQSSAYIAALGDNKGR